MSVPRAVPGAAAGDGVVLAQAGGFGDVADGAYYSTPVAVLGGAGVFAGTECGPGLLCPDEPIDRKTMAVWTVRVVTGEDPPAVPETRFADVDADGFYAPFVERMAELEITLGCGDGTRFCPDDTVTRAQMAVFLSRAFGLADGPDPGFSDVPDGAWYGTDVARLAHSGITKGCGDGTVFCPGEDTTRAQMATFLHRALVRDVPPPVPVSQSEAMAIGEVAQESGFGDPYQVELPEPVETSTTLAWLGAGGGAIVGLVARIAEFWTEDEPDCATIAADLDRLGTPSRLRTAATMTRDPVTAELLSTVLFGAAAMLRSCGNPDNPDSAEHAWQWSLAYRRLVHLGVVSGCLEPGCAGSAGTGPNGSESHADLPGRASLQPVLLASAASIPAPANTHWQQPAQATPAPASATIFTRLQTSSVSFGSISWQSAGDSYSSGQGLRERRGPCARSRLAYGPEAVRVLEARGWDIGPVTFTACSGAVTEQYFNNWSTPWGPSVPETIAICGGHPACIAALPRGTHTIDSQWQQGLDQGGPERVDIIVMSFGGNDIGFADVLDDCVTLPDSWLDVFYASGCDISEQAVKSRIDTLRGSIIDLYESIVTDRLSSRGKLFVVGYPRLFAPVKEWSRWNKIACQSIWRGDTEKLSELAKYLDEKLKDAVKMANSRLGAADRIHYLDLFSLYRDNKAELCGTNPDWLDGLRAPPYTTCCSFHPNATGHSKTATKLADLIAQEWPAAVCPPPSGQGLIAYGAGDSVWTADPDTGIGCLAAVGGSHPAWSPDGTRLAFAHHADRAIKVLDLETRRVSTVVPYLNPPYAYVVEAAHDLAWSPSGDEIAFTALSGGDYDIVIANSDATRTWRKLTDSPTTGEYQPAWSPDGTKIAYASNRDGDNDIYITNADGTGTPTNITNGPRTTTGRTLSDGNETHPAWANDGRIAFASDRDDSSGASNIYIVLDENHPTWAILTNTPGRDQTHPDWSPDGTQMTISYRTTTTDTYNIGRIDLTGGGTNWTAIARTQAQETHPTWAPATEPPHTAPPPAPTAASNAVTAGEYHTCGLKTDNTITCWGNNGSGQTDAPNGTFNAATAGGAHTCGLKTDNTITCWGRNREGQTDAPNGTFNAATAGRTHTCGLKTDNTITCWGSNGYGQTDAPNGTFNAATASLYHTCGLKTDNTITCWGRNNSGQTDAPNGTFNAATAGWEHTCGLKTDNTITCWGNNGSGQTDAPNGTFNAVTADGAHTCGLKTDNTITCWGWNRDGQTDAPNGTFNAVTAGVRHTCGLKTDNTITCWGGNEHGQADAPNGTFGPAGGSGATVTVTKGGPGPTEIGPGQGIPCGANTPTCRYLNIELRGFAAGTYTVSCSHDGWDTEAPSTFWTFTITVDAGGSASRNGPCFINFAKLTANGAYVTVSRTGTQTVTSNWLK